MRYGPTLPLSEEIDSQKYRLDGESFEQSIWRLAKVTDEPYVNATAQMLLEQRFLPAGRVRAAVGNPRHVTALNCYVAPPLPDTMEGIMDVLKYAALTMKQGGGIGYDFSTLRPRGDFIRTLDSRSSGPVSFMEIFDAMCGTIASAGHRRGAQMGVLRVDHPDIFEFVRAKKNTNRLTNFNISVAVTDEFMECLEEGKPFDLKFEGKVYETIDPKVLWDEIMQANFDWAEPGVLFIDRINANNNLWYVENIAATNPCGEQPLPPHGACLLGSFNLVKYVRGPEGERDFDFVAFAGDVRLAVRFLDNVLDNTHYPHPEQREEALSKRRMGLGVTGLANAGEALGYPYASDDFMVWAEEVFRTLRDDAYNASCELAGEKGPFPLFEADSYVLALVGQGASPDTINKVYNMGIRNSHLISFAPTGTISLAADNVSSGIEPVFSYGFSRTVNLATGTRTEKVEDYGVRVFGKYGRRADEISPEEHVRVQALAQEYSDSAVSKTANVGAHVTFEQFKEIYLLAWELGAKGCTTYRAAGKRAGILVADIDEAQEDDVGTACFIDPDTGQKSCG